MLHKKSIKQVKDKLVELEVNTIPEFSSKQLFQMPFSVEAHDGLMVISIHVPTYEQHNDLFTTYEWVEVPWKIKNGTTLALIPKPTKTFIAINNCYIRGNTNEIFIATYRSYRSCLADKRILRSSNLAKYSERIIFNE